MACERVKPTYIIFVLTYGLWCVVNVTKHKKDFILKEIYLFCVSGLDVSDSSGLRDNV